MNCPHVSLTYHGPSGPHESFFNKLPQDVVDGSAGLNYRCFHHFKVDLNEDPSSETPCKFSKYKNMATVDGPLSHQEFSARLAMSI
jgi:hypothetical protein